MEQNDRQVFCVDCLLSSSSWTWEVLNHCSCELYLIYNTKLLFMKQSHICRVKRTHRMYMNHPRTDLKCTERKSGWMQCSFSLILHFALTCYLYFKANSCSECLSAGVNKSDVDMQSSDSQVNHKPQPSRRLPCKAKILVHAGSFSTNAGT